MFGELPTLLGARVSIYICGRRVRPQLDGGTHRLFFCATDKIDPPACLRATERRHSPPLFQWRNLLNSLRPREVVGGPQFGEQLSRWRTIHGDKDSDHDVRLVRPIFGSKGGNENRRVLKELKGDVGRQSSHNVSFVTMSHANGK